MIQPKRVFELLAAFVLVAILFSSLKSANQFYPYYLSWDMDLTTTIDLLIVQGQRIHVHFAHPATGMIMILKPIHFIAHWLGYVDTLTLSDLSIAHNPSLSVAQLTDFLRSISPFVITLVCILLCSVVFILGVDSLLFRILSIGLIFSSYWVIQEATFIRTETFAWFYLSLSCLFSALAAKSDSINFKRLFLVLMGLFLGMTYYTKIQSLTTLSLPLILFFIFNDFDFAPEKNYYKKMSTLTLGIYLSLVTISFFYGFPPDTYIEHFREQVAVTFHGALITGVLIYLCRIHFKTSKFSERWYPYLVIGVPVAFGFVISFFLPLIQYSSFSRGIELTLLNFQSVVMTKIYSGLSNQIAPRPTKVIGVLIAALPILVPLLISYFLLFLGHKNKYSSQIRWGLTALVALVLFNLIFVVRDAARHDIIWYETLSSLAILLTASFLWKEKAILKWSSVAILVYMIGVNFINTNLAYNNSQFSYGEERAFLKQSYPGQRDYTALFNERTSGMDENRARQFTSQLLTQARDHRKIDYFLRFHYTNLKPDIRWISSAQKDWKVSGTNWKVVDVAESLKAQNLLDLTEAVNHTTSPNVYQEFVSHLLIEPQFNRKWVDPRDKIYLRIQNDISSQILIDPSQNSGIDCTPVSKDSWITIENSENKLLRLESHYCAHGIPFKTIKGPALSVMIFNSP